MGDDRETVAGGDGTLHQVVCPRCFGYGRVRAEIQAPEAVGGDPRRAEGVVFACHVDAHAGDPPQPDCVLDYGQPGDCNLAYGRRVRETCKNWRPLKMTP